MKPKKSKSFNYCNHAIFTGTARIIDQDKEPELTAGVSKLMSTKY